MPIWAALGLGFLFSFAHCVGMCGGFVAAYSLTLSDRGRSDWWPHLAYSLGRTVSYSVIGLLAGSVGSVVRLGGHLAGLQDALSLLAGAVMLALGVGMLGVRLVRLPSPALFPGFRALFARAMAAPGWIRTFGVGLVNGWLPCGMVYSGAALALSAGSPAGGALTMAAFGLGTTPAMLLLGLFAGNLGTAMRQRLQYAGALVMMGAGVMALWRGIA